MVAWLASGVALACSGSAFAQFQSHLLTPPIALDESNEGLLVLAGTVDVETEGVLDVALTAHAYIEGQGFGPTNVYEVRICRLGEVVSTIGSASWVPVDRDAVNAFEGDTVSVTAFDADVVGPVSYAICVVKSAGADVTVYGRGLNAIVAPAATALAGEQQLSSIETIGIDSTDRVGLGSVVVSGPGSYDVALTGHARISVNPTLLGGERYAIEIRRDSINGTAVGRGYFLPAAGDDTSASDTIAVTGFDTGRSGDTTYVLCGRKVDDTAPNAVVGQHGLIARTAPASTTLSGVEETVLGPVAVLDSTTSVAIEQVAAAGQPPFDVALTGHVYLEGQGFSNDRYAIEICRGDVNGARVGRAQWRPLQPPGNSDYVGDTVLVTGYDAGLTEATTYVLCGSKIGSTGPDVLAELPGLVAEVVPDSGANAGALSAIATLVRIVSTRRTCG